MDKPKKTPTISQAMVDAYDEYTHLTLDRRSFMDKLAKLAGSGAAAAVIAPMLAANSHRPQSSHPTIRGCSPRTSFIPARRET